MTKFFLFFSVASMLLFAACKKDKDSGPTDDKNYYMSADLNGVATTFKFEPLADTNVFTNYAVVSASPDSNSYDNIWFHVPDDLTTGTYKESDGVYMGYYVSGKAHLSVDDDAVVTITSKTSTTVQGTFSGTVKYQEREFTSPTVLEWVTKSTIVIKNGKFNVKIGTK